MKKILAAVLIGFAVSLSGCAHIFRVQVDAINDGQESPNKTFIIVPGDPAVDKDDLQFREFARYLSRALKYRGFIPAGNGQAPDVEIFLSYGLGEPRARVRTYSVPVWGQTSTEVTTTESTYETKTGTNTVSTTSITPEYGVTGYATREQIQTVYPKFVEVSGYDIKNAKPGEKLIQLWKTTLHYEGKRNEIRSVFPVLMAVAANYLGGNTGREIEVALTRKNELVQMIKHGQ